MKALPDIARQGGVFEVLHKVRHSLDATMHALMLISIFLSSMQLQIVDLPNMLKRGLVSVDLNPSGYAHESFHYGMACTVLENLGVVKGGKDGVFYADSLMEYLEQTGRWTNYA